MVGTLLEKVLCICGFLFPLMELCQYLSGRVLLSTGSPLMRRLQQRYLSKLGLILQRAPYPYFGVMVVLFITLSKGWEKKMTFFGKTYTTGLSKSLRFNMCQAVLMSIVIQCFTSVWMQMPFVIREAAVGQALCNAFFWGWAFTMGYCVFFILLGRYPFIPVLSEAARLHVQG